MTGGPRNVLATAAMAGWLDIGTWTVPLRIRSHASLAIGRVRLSGRLAGPSPNDPNPCVRAEAGEAYGCLYVSSSAEGVMRYGLPIRSIREDLCLTYLAAGRTPP
jgi:hypothetical protein